MNPEQFFKTMTKTEDSKTSKKKIFEAYTQLGGEITQERQFFCKLGNYLVKNGIKKERDYCYVALKDLGQSSMNNVIEDVVEDRSENVLENISENVSRNVSGNVSENTPRNLESTISDESMVMEYDYNKTIETYGDDDEEEIIETYEEEEETVEVNEMDCAEPIECGSPKIASFADNKICQALCALSFDVQLLQKYDFDVWVVFHQTFPHRGFLELKDVSKYLTLGRKNSIVISLNVPKEKFFFVCAVIASDSTIQKCTEDYGKVLVSIRNHYPKIQRGKKTHLQSGDMYPYGYRGNRNDKDYDQYYRDSTSNDEEWEQFSTKMEQIGNRYFDILSTYFPSLAQQFYDIRNNNHCPGVGYSHAGNFITAFNFASAIHFDPRDTTYAFGAWFDYGSGTIANSHFVFPEFCVGIKIHNGICVLWNARKALHSTTISSPHNCLRIGTVIQLNQILVTKAWNKYNQSSHRKKKPYDKS